ncbi:MAG: response regulator [Opitutaceae bacterium]|nr:response regulator [Opitutaceae bacterium]
MSAAPILLVEDDENDVFFFERALKRAGCTHPVHVARDGEEAIAYFTKAGAAADRASRLPLPCLTLLDLDLPRMAGLEVLEWIREHMADLTVPVIVLTASTSKRAMREAYRLGAKSCLLKPSHPDELVKLVQALKGYWSTEEPGGLPNNFRER